MAQQLVYLDNAATSWPKPESVGQAMNRFLTTVGANPGRAGHRLANESARIVYDAREAVAGLFGMDDPLRVVFGPNVTYALNLVLKGYLRSGDHVITSSMEHNSMMRPLRALEKDGVAVTVVDCSPAGELDPADVRKAIRKATRLIALNHASNVTGTLQPVANIGLIAREHNTLLLLDTAQSAGSVNIDMHRDNIDLVAFTGHKSLLGPMGTGGLVFGQRAQIDAFCPLLHGGTGSRSEHEIQPEFAPDKFESGTPNVVGLAGLLAGIQWVCKRSTEQIRAHELSLVGTFIEGIHGIDGIRIHGLSKSERRVGNISFEIEGIAPSEAALRLDEEYGILCRAGLHCAPAAHRTIGTFPEGSIRFGFGPLNTQHDVTLAIEAVQALAGKAKS